MKSISIAVLALATCLIYAEPAITDGAYSDSYLKSIAQMEAKYPDLLDEKSVMYRLLNQKVTEAIESKHPDTAEADYVLKYADEIAAELSKLGVKIQIVQPDQERVTLIPPNDNALLEEANQRLRAEDAKNKEEIRLTHSRILAAEKQMKQDAQKALAALNDYPEPVPPSIDLARAQTLARSSKNPEAQREGQRMLQEWANYQQQVAIYRQVKAGQIAPESAYTAQMRMEAQGIADQTAEMQRQLDDQRAMLDAQRAEMERQRWEMEQQIFRQKVEADRRRAQMQMQQRP